DRMDVDNYDHFMAPPDREVITVETKLTPSNKGFAMLAKLGWVEGQPLGVSGDGRVDPVPFQIKRDSTGLGKLSQDVRMIETTVSQRRGMESERMTKETEDQRKAREDAVARRSAVESEISTTLKAFYCDLCEKQFKTVVAYTEHTNSYAHHHKARFKDMQANIRIIPQDDVDKRKEKERKREEKELRKIAAANGIKMAKPSAAVISTLAPAHPIGVDGGTGMDIDGVSAHPEWASASASRPTESQPALRKSGWATVGASSSLISEPAPPPEQPRPSSPPVPTSSGHPAFRTAGWTYLDTGSSQPPSAPPPAANPPPPPPPPNAAPPPPPEDFGPPPLRAGGWSTV
ncbi:G-patch-domain Zn-finger DNA-binding protein, partial [Mycena belliarum]